MLSSLWQGCAAAVVLAIVAIAAPAAAVDREGQGRVELSGGLRFINNNPFVQNARAQGYDLQQENGLGPAALATFGYWLDSQFELSLEGGYGHDSYSAKAAQSLSLDSETIMAAIRWNFIQGYAVWPYLGGGFGYSFNNVSGAFAAPYNSWSATGYGGAGLAGFGWDFSSHWGLTVELRYTIALLAPPTGIASPLNAGGFSLLVGVYYRIAKSVDSLVVPSP